MYGCNLFIFNSLTSLIALLFLFLLTFSCCRICINRRRHIIFNCLLSALLRGLRSVPLGRARRRIKNNIWLLLSVAHFHFLLIRIIITELILNDLWIVRHILNLYYQIIRININIIFCSKNQKVSLLIQLSSWFELLIHPFS